MKKALLLPLAVLLLISCGGVKQTEKALNTGNYDQAIGIALKNLRTRKDKKGKQDYVIMLEQAYAKVVERDLDNIAYLEKDGNPANFERIYDIYTILDARQERIKPLLPLRIIEERRQARFDMKDYSDKIVETKEKLSDYLYRNAQTLLSNATNKMDFRNAFEDLEYLNKINPGYRNIKNLMEEAHFKGTDFVYVKMKNETQMVIPIRLEEDLLNFDTYGLNDMWTVYHGNKLRDLKYDFGMEIALRDINISPEQIREKQVIKEKQVKDGWKYLYDNDGNVVKDSLGNKIKVDKFRTVRCELYEFTQFKATQVVGRVQFKDLNTGQLLEAFPIDSEFIFEHLYADYDGDRRALDDHYLGLINVRAVPFPTNEQMVYDTGEDLKLKIKEIITRNRFRN